METRKKNRNKKSSPLKKTIFILLGILVVLLVGATAFLGKTYFDVKNTANKVSKPVEGRVDTTNIKDGEPFSVLLLGLDTGEFGRTDVGRSDTILVATVNPKENKTTLVSVPRDTRMEMVGHGTVEKAAHAYAYGQEKMALDSMEKFLDIPLDHYVWINMEGFEDLVNAVDGVEVNNKFEFEQDGHKFSKGKNKLNGDQALAYTRMRYEDPNGDYGRQVRQQEVIGSIADRALTFSGVTRYKQILKAIEDNMKTDLEPEEMFTIAKDYRNCFTTIDNETLHGNGETIDGLSYQVIPDEELARVQALLKQQLPK
ncbi:MULTISPECIES: LCP family protein [Vagococcus]|uniref:Cell envelope-associated transcriptional attenuator LytR-CpsA-Psr, subfamily F2 (As in PMID19099556) n=1 Tax=Vagococcus fluvialis bH819 TaxID=1255619 RepID=A0A1X6WPX4_9ENTE|nr:MULTISPECIES: LCP family protein [Vagococcus]SLM86320.1 Cell envelope-associated transcriptional attenuator LytR-CpsA-Psr, subfamily F2 (as in PMID19099556) [Vagococcus fluvialis bH819]HCM88972.1 transcriptional regulator [Vagococcus sp.]